MTKKSLTKSTTGKRSGKRPRAGAGRESKVGVADGAGASDGGGEPDPAPAASHPKRGRPKTIADMKAYKAQKERERRAKKKSAEAK